MGTQQLLLIVLGVIIVGIAIAVGITIFNNQAYNANQQAVSQELNTLASQVIQWWKTPEQQGGAGQVPTNVTLAKVSTWLDFTPATGVDPTPSDNGSYKVVSVDATAGGEEVVLAGLGTEKRGTNYPLVTVTIDLNASDISTVVSAAAALPTGE